MVKHERLPPKKRASTDLPHPAASTLSALPQVSASSDSLNPFVKRDRADAAISHLKPSGTRNKNSGFDEISKRKRVRLDKREKKKLMALAGKLKCCTSKKAAPSASLEVRARADAAKERERKKRQKLKKKRLQLAAASAPSGAKKRRSRSQVAADAVAAVAAAAEASSSISSTACLSSDHVISALERSTDTECAPSKKVLRKLLMKEMRLAAKAVSQHGVDVNPQEKTCIIKSLDAKKRSRSLDDAFPAMLHQAERKKQRSVNDFPYQVDSSDHAETPAGHWEGGGG
jgi:hypothetical protein